MPAQTVVFVPTPCTMPRLAIARGVLNHTPSSFGFPLVQSVGPRCYHSAQPGISIPCRPDAESCVVAFEAMSSPVPPLVACHKTREVLGDGAQSHTYTRSTVVAARFTYGHTATI